MKLTNRLITISNLCRGSDTVIDVGCDHAKLPIYLVENHLANGAIATDIHPGPVENARKNILQAGLQGKIKVNMCDGLKDFTAADCDTVVIAGMGSEEMIDILSAAPWTKSGNHKIILQPMSREYKLRRYLWQNQYKVIAEQIAIEGEKVYVVLLAQWQAKPFEEEHRGLFSQALLKCDDRIYYINKLIDKYEKQLFGLERSTGRQDERLVNIIQYLKSVGKG